MSKDNSEKLTRKAVSKAIVGQFILSQSTISEEEKRFRSKYFICNKVIFERSFRGPLTWWKVRRTCDDDCDSNYEWLTFKDSRKVEAIWKVWKYNSKHANEIVKYKNILTAMGYQNV